MISGIVDKLRSALGRMFPQNSITFACIIGPKNYSPSPRRFNLDKTVNEIKSHRIEIDRIKRFSDWGGKRENVFGDKLNLHMALIPGPVNW